MQKFQGLLFMLKLSFICYYMICMTVPLAYFAMIFILAREEKVMLFHNFKYFQLFFLKKWKLVSINVIIFHSRLKNAFFYSKKKETYNAWNKNWLSLNKWFEFHTLFDKFKEYFRILYLFGQIWTMYNCIYHDSTRWTCWSHLDVLTSLWSPS